MQDRMTSGRRKIGEMSNRPGLSLQFSSMICERRKAATARKMVPTRVRTTTPEVMLIAAMIDPNACTTMIGALRRIANKIRRMEAKATMMETRAS